jgi:hypothetical protein
MSSEEEDGEIVTCELLLPPFRDVAIGIRFDVSPTSDEEGADGAGQVFTTLPFLTSS